MERREEERRGEEKPGSVVQEADSAGIKRALPLEAAVGSHRTVHSNPAPASLRLVAS